MTSPGKRLLVSQSVRKKGQLKDQLARDHENQSKNVSSSSRQSQKV